ncbi:MAG: hypothetical protein IID44_16960 [Planctomycetes bacterium]|nr:hypothetical protein [Planctomycetota bacterium]
MESHQDNLIHSSNKSFWHLTWGIVVDAIRSFFCPLFQLRSWIVSVYSGFVQLSTALLEAKNGLKQSSVALLEAKDELKELQSRTQKFSEQLKETHEQLANRIMTACESLDSGFRGQNELSDSDDSYSCFLHSFGPVFYDYSSGGVKVYGVSDNVAARIDEIRSWSENANALFKYYSFDQSAFEQCEILSTAPNVNVIGFVGNRIEGVAVERLAHWYSSESIVKSQLKQDATIGLDSLRQSLKRLEDSATKSIKLSNKRFNKLEKQLRELIKNIQQSYSPYQAKGGMKIKGKSQGMIIKDESQENLGGRKPWGQVGISD